MVVTGPDRPVANAGALVAVPNEHDGERVPFGRIVETWLALTYALNAVNRSMGAGDLYPFVLAPTAIEKLAFVHDLVTAPGPSAVAVAAGTGRDRDAGKV
jgi:hypothetical protein